VASHPPRLRLSPATAGTALRSRRIPIGCGIRRSGTRQIAPPLIVPAGVKLGLFHAYPSEEAAMGDPPGVDVSVAPSGTGCVECEAGGGWWFHLRRCAHCGHIGCCDNSPSQHATAHARSTGHPVIRSFEPGEDWFWDYRSSTYFVGPELAPPAHHPADQPVPGPASRVPSDWEEQLH
jgi:hypothetical protein